MQATASGREAMKHVKRKVKAREQSLQSSRHLRGEEAHCQKILCGLTIGLVRYAEAITQTPREISVRASLIKQTQDLS